MWCWRATGSGSAAAMQREQHRRRGPLSSSPPRSSAGTISQLGLIKPTDPLLLIDFLIINSVCPSISLRFRISPSQAKALCDLPPSGYQPATDLGDLNPCWEFWAFPGKATIHKRAQIKTQGASNKPASTATCA